MKSFRDPKYVERYADVVFDLETALNTGTAEIRFVTSQHLVSGI